MKKSYSTSLVTNFYETPIKLGADNKRYSLDQTSLRLGEALQLQQLVKKAGTAQTLEIGCALGASSVAIAEVIKKNPGAKHIVLDPYQEAFGNVGKMELERLGLHKIVELHPVCSEEYLQSAVKDGRKFNFIFHDGGHGIGQKVADTFFAEKLLSTGGVMAFHDAFLNSTAACLNYLIRECKFEIVSMEPDSAFKRLARTFKYGLRHGFWFGTKVVPFTYRSLVAVRKTPDSTRPQ